MEAQGVQPEPLSREPLPHLPNMQSRMSPGRTLTLCLVAGAMIMVSCAHRREPLPLATHSAVEGGYWNSGNFDGSYRVSIVQDAIDQSRQVVYLEWIDSLHERARSYREHGIRVREINGKLWRLERPKFHQVGKTFVITIPATHRYLDEGAEFQIWPWVNHEYTFRQEPLPPEAIRQIHASYAERAVGG